MDQVKKKKSDWDNMRFFFSETGQKKNIKN